MGLLMIGDPNSNYPPGVNGFDPHIWRDEDERDMQMSDEQVKALKRDFRNHRSLTADVREDGTIPSNGVELLICPPLFMRGGSDYFICADCDGDAWVEFTIDQGCADGVVRIPDQAVFDMAGLLDPKREAAPDLYEALEGMLQLTVPYCEKPDCAVCRENAFIRTKAKAALAKARGES